MEVLEKTQEMEKQGQHIIYMEVGEPDFDMPQCTRDAVCRVENIKEGLTRLESYICNRQHESKRILQLCFRFFVCRQFESICRL